MRRTAGTSFRGHRLLCTTPAKTMFQKALSPLHHQTELISLYHILGHQNFQEGTCNHCSSIIPEHPSTNKRALLTSKFGKAWQYITPNDLICLDLESGTPIRDNNFNPTPNPVTNPTQSLSLCQEQSWNPPFEYEETASIIHRGIAMQRPDITCIIHTHSPHITALSCLPDPLNRILPIHQTSLRFMKNVYYDSIFDGFAVSDTQLRHLSDIMKDNPHIDIIVLANHGVLVTGANVALAYDRLYYLEIAAKLQILTLSVTQGWDFSTADVRRRLRLIDESVIELTCKQWEESEEMYARTHFESAKMTVERQMHAHASGAGLGTAGRG